ncbi:MAG TPA: hypothetical protein VMR96_08120 [Solirubrobacterales bacterium]|nr:hypothetical protein [Solirubrobacterales bacterium]
MDPWKLPLIVAGVVVPIAAAFMLGGPGMGVAVGALVMVVLIAFAVRQRPEGPIDSAGGGDARRHVLIVAADGVEDPVDVARIARVAGLREAVGGEDEVRVLVPARIGFLDRWASDVEGARHHAQQRLVVTVAALAKAGVAAEARVGDEDIVQAVEDQLQSYPATAVVLVSGGDEGEGEAAEVLRSRLRAEFHHVQLAGSE